MGNPIPMPPRLNIWEEFEQDFVQDWTDTNEHYKVASKLDQLQMIGSDIDAYIVQFGELVQKAQYHEDDLAVLNKFK